MMVVYPPLILLTLFLMTPLLAVTRAGPVPTSDFHFLNEMILRHDSNFIQKDAWPWTQKRHSYDDGLYKQEYSYNQDQGDWNDDSNYNNDKNPKNNGKDDVATPPPPPPPPSWVDDQRTSSQKAWVPTSTLSSYTSSVAIVPSPTWSSPSGGNTVQLPLAMATPPTALTPERISLITGQVIKARQRALDSSKTTPTNPSLIWQSPSSGDGFTAGQQVTLQWTSTLMQQIPSMNLRLCLLRSDTDLQNAQNDTLNTNQACGSAVTINCSASTDRQSTLLSFAAPTLQSADSYFIILSPPFAQSIPQQSPSQPVANSAAVPTLAKWRKRATGDLISPPFVLAPHGIDLSTLNNMQSSPPSSVNDLAAQNQSTSATQEPQVDDAGKARPIAWAWIVGPIAIVVALLIVGSLLYCYRRGQKRARLTAEERERARIGNDPWREATAREISRFSQSTTNPILSGIPPSYQRYHAVLPISVTPSRTSQPSMMERRDLSRVYAHDIPIDEPGHTLSLQRNSSRATSSASSLSSNDQLPYCRSEREDRAQDIIDAYDRHTQALLERDASMKSHYSLYPVLTPLPVPIALRPRNSLPRAFNARVSREVMMSNPHEKPYEVEPARHHSYPTRKTPLRDGYVEGGKGRTLSHSAAERSTTTGKIGTPYDFVSEELIHRADEANDVYLQLKQALQQTSASTL